MQRRTSMATTSASNRFAAELRRQLGLYARLMRLDRPIGIMAVAVANALGAVDRRRRPAGPANLPGLCARRHRHAQRRLRHQRLCRPQTRPPRCAHARPAAGNRRSGTRRSAGAVFLALCLLAIALLLTLNSLARWLAVAGAALTIIYPFTKRFFVAPQLILGAAFGWGVPMAFAAQTGQCRDSPG